MIEDFLCRVSFAGVPHAAEHNPNINQATIRNISAGDMCTLFWLLEKIQLAYSFSINGVSVYRDFYATSEVEPKYRLIAPVELYASSYDSSTMTSYLCRLNFDTVYFGEGGECGLGFLFSEIDTTGAINLNLQPMAGMQNVSLGVPFFNSAVTVYLNYLPSVVNSAQINYFEIKLTFA
ncbi:MAG: hypothetical protein LBD33_02575, partial [Puniceicoccales bacterium]|nr:hypothetical protein [Puniceicoccales bacterium]